MFFFVDPSKSSSEAIASDSLQFGAFSKVSWSLSCVSSDAIALQALVMSTYRRNLVWSIVLIQQKPASADLTSEARIGSATFSQKGQKLSLLPLSRGQFENWGESSMADNSPRTDTSTDVETDDRNQRVILCSFVIILSLVWQSIVLLSLVLVFSIIEVQCYPIAWLFWSICTGSVLFLFWVVFLCFSCL